MTSLTAGQVVPEREFAVQVADTKVFSLIMSDPNPIHFDPHHTAALGMGDRPVNQGTLNMAYPIDALIQLIGDPVRIVRFRCRFLGTVVDGDRVVAGGTVVSVVDDVAEVELWLDRVGAGRVLTGAATVRLASG